MTGREATLATVLADANLLSGLDLDDGSSNAQAVVFARDLLRAIWLYLTAPPAAPAASFPRAMAGTVNAQQAARANYVAGVIEDVIRDPRVMRASIEILTGMAAEANGLTRGQLAGLYAADLTGDEDPGRS